ncbi:MAG: hypothetical protein ACFFCZ_19085 [Promethearchaeota archaeon]
MTEKAQNINQKSLETLAEIFKETFNNEERRKDTLENKASMVLGFSGIITGLITGLMSSSLVPATNIFFTIFFLASVLFFTIAGIFALLTVRLMEYVQPFRVLKPEEIDELLKTDGQILQAELIKNYSDSIVDNTALNNRKSLTLRIAFYSATLGIILTSLAALTVLI